MANRPKSLSEQFIKRMMIDEFPEMEKYMDYVTNFTKTKEGTFFRIGDEVPSELKRKVYQWYEQVSQMQ